jgi:hypothetical protein
VFGTREGTPISPNNVLRRSIFPACDRLGLPHATWLTFRRTYSSWSHDKGVPGKVVAQLMGHSNVDTTLNVYTQVSTVQCATPSRRSAANCSRLFTAPKRRPRKLFENIGAPCRTRTCDLLVRSQTLYPTELRALLRPEPKP